MINQDLQPVTVVVLLAILHVICPHGIDDNFRARRDGWKFR
jgi:hypothetical protein